MVPSGSKRRPVRSCVGCGQRTEPERLIRFILDPEGGVVADLAGSGFGRGSWVHAHPECLKQAASRGFSKSFKQKVTCSLEAMEANIAAAAERRIMGLLGAAWRSRRLLLGGQAVADDLQAVQLGLLADDARAAASDAHVAELGARGRLIVWGSKSRLGDALGRGDVALVGLTDPGLAAAVRFAVSLTQLSLQTKEVPEVR